MHPLEFSTENLIQKVYLQSIQSAFDEDFKVNDT